MKKIFMVIFAVFFLSFAFLCSCEEGKDKEDISKLVDMSERLINISGEPNIETLAEAISPAVVGISSATEYSESVGSGVCVAKGGYILTNSHVISNPNNIELYLYNGKTAKASQIFNDESLDISILKTEESMPFLALGNTDEIGVGEDVLAVGTPLSILLKHSFTKGIVSALNRTLKISSENGDYYMQDLIQHDASLNPGNSGGPLINSKGEIIGINTLKITSGEGIGFAIPCKSFERLLKNYIKDINYETPYLGLFGYDAEIANYYQYTNQKSGVFVVDVSENGPLSSIGISRGDVVVAINGNKIDNILDLRDELFKYSCGDSVEIQFIKNGKVYAGDVCLIRHPVNNISKDIELVNLN